MKLLKILLSVFAAGIVSVLAVQAFYKKVYKKWKYYTLYDDEGEDKWF